MAKKEVDQALGLLTYGVYVVTTARDGRRGAALTPWVSQVSLKPPLVSFSIPRGHLLTELLGEGAPFVVNVLKAGQKPLAEAFVGDAPEDDALRGRSESMTESGCPYLSEALAIVECAVQGTVDAGKGAVLVLGQVTRASLLSEGQPLTLRQTGIKEYF